MTAFYVLGIVFIILVVINTVDNDSDDHWGCP